MINTKIRLLKQAAVIALTLTGGLMAGPGNAFAGKADVVGAVASKSGSTWRFDVTVRHDDKGWKHYADNFQILSMDGTVLGTRVLAHPHEHEQPFTRSLGGISLPAGTTKVRIRAHDLVHGYGGKEVILDLPK